MKDEKDLEKSRKEKKKEGERRKGRRKEQKRKEKTSINRGERTQRRSIE